MRSNINNYTAPLEQGIPDDIILVIAEYLSAPDILSFCLVSQRMHNVLLSSLYTSVQLKTNEQCRLAMKAFTNNPNVKSIRRLFIYPNRASDWAWVGSGKHLKESEFTIFLKGLVSAGRLSGLHTFEWNGLEAPTDELWMILRTCCPQLKNIGLTVGVKTYHIASESHLFDFRDLLGFSLTIQKSAKWSPFLKGGELPERLWEMLLVNSPNLRELTLEGKCQAVQLWDIRRILSGRWPCLRSVAFGSLSFYESSNEEGDMTTFLSAHPTLENIRFLSGLYYSRTSMFYLPSLPSLHSFTGRIQQLTMAPELPSLRSLYFTDWFSPSARFADILQSIPTVTTLSISVNFLESSERKTYRGLYERVINACSELTHLEISSTGPLALRDFSSALSLGSRLRSFVVTRTRRLTDEDMTISATRIASQNPSLQWFIIRDVTGWDHLDQLDEKFRFKQVGTYRILASDMGGAPCLQIHEMSVNHFGRRSIRSSTRMLHLAFQG